MESVVFEDSPLAAYLEGEGGEDASNNSDNDGSTSSSSPSFAPRGQPKSRLRLRNKVPPPLRLSIPIPRSQAVATIHKTYSRAINSSLGRADNTRFLERFRYIIVASQLLSTHSYLGPTVHITARGSAGVSSPSFQQRGAFTLAGASVTVCCVFSLVWTIKWVLDGKYGLTRILTSLLILPVLFFVSQAYIRRQWLHYLRQQALSETSEFATKAQEYDQVVGAAMTLVQEVELVSRGYRISTPLPPISRLEDRSQNRRCSRLRKSLRSSFAELIPLYKNACAILEPLTEQVDLEKYYDIYDISDIDLTEAMQGYIESEFEDLDSLRVLKILAARFHLIRKIFLCGLMALNASGGKADFPRWDTAVEEVKTLTTATNNAEEGLRSILDEEENFPVPPTPKLPLSPNRERWRAQLRKLGALSTGIRGLQAKLHVLREESESNLNDSEDVSELGTNMMIQYESIGLDLKALIQEWEDGKAALAQNIDRNEKRFSSMSGMLSPTISLGGLTAVDEGSEGAISDALKALNGEGRSRYSMDLSSSDMDAEEVFEAVAMPRQRPKSSMTREERIAKMKEDRVRKEASKEIREANTYMLRELESVINLRPRNRATMGGRITSI